MLPKLLAMFPGQGSQSIGMGKELLTQFPKAKLLFEEAEDAIQVKLRLLCLEGPAAELELTANQQPCILALSVAFWQVLRAETALEPSLFAGHSLGEYSALVASGKLAFTTAVKLVRQRGLAMQAAVAPGVGAMAAVLGGSAETLSSLCAEESSSGRHVVEVVNFNSPQQHIISGHQKAVSNLCARLKEQSIKSVLLSVSAPFHSSLMAPAREAMTPLLQGQTFAKGQGDVIANLTGRVVKDYTSHYLIKQIDSPVLWTRTLATAAKAEVSAYIEVGPGKVLSGLARRCLQDSPRIIASVDIKKAITELNSLS